MAQIRNILDYRSFIRTYTAARRLAQIRNILDYRSFIRTYTAVRRLASGVNDGDDDDNDIINSM